MKKVLKEFWIGFLSLIYPEVCIACRDILFRGEKIFCTDCLLDLPFLNFSDWKENALYTQLEWRMPGLAGANSFFQFRKKSGVQHILHAIKYENQPDLAYKMGNWMYTKWEEQMKELAIDYVVPVPLHAARKRQRGYNQSEEIAKGLIENTSLKISVNNLVRIKKTKTQTKQKRMQRWLNMQTVFHLKHPNEFANKNILLIDDVITTGATLESCYELLSKAGVASVYVASIAKA